MHLLRDRTVALVVEELRAVVLEGVLFRSLLVELQPPRSFDLVSNRVLALCGP